MVASRANDRLAVTEGRAATLLESFLSSVRIVKVFHAADSLVQVYDDQLEKVSSILTINTFDRS